MSTVDFKELLNRYLNDTLTNDELRELLAHLQQHQHDHALQQVIQQTLQDNSFKELSNKDRSDIIFQQIMKQAGNGPPLVAAEAAVETGPRKLYLVRWTAAAAILVAILSITYLFIQKDRSTTAIVDSPKQTPPVNDVAPGGNKAILQLADGSTITLDDSATGLLAQQGNTKIIKLNNGRLAYNSQAQQNGPVLYNTITTPRGGQYHIILPDGSKVWLNAASSLRFPTVFAGKERNVELTGEGYFEIEHDQQKPFHVQTHHTKIEVLGTHFNVKGYENEHAISTTLLEGSVRVSVVQDNKLQSALLKPGEQASVSHSSPASHPIPVQTVDAESVIAWKNGLFQFNSDDIQTIMLQLERWYDIEVQYKGPIPDGHYSGTVPRANNLQKVLRILEESDLKFVLEGKKLTVL